MLFLLAGLSAVAAPENSSFYKNPHALFSTRPSEKKSIQTIDRFGPVGMSIELIQPAFVMQIGTIEEGSPAAATGKFKKGQIIESINGEALKDIDPRVQMAQWIEKAEATDGKLTFSIKGLDAPVVVEIPVMGVYSDSWPLDCPKSDKIVRGLADYIAESEDHYGLGDLGMFFLMSTGNEKDTKVVGEWARKASNPSRYAWYLGFGGIPLCEYYLRTGDQEVLPNIQKWVNEAVAGQYLDAWAGRGGVCSVTYGNGHLNAGGTSVVTFLLLAKECGVDVPDHALMGALRHFYRYAGRGGNPYGDGRPEMGFVDNGKNGILAFAMAAAASLTPDGENSVYARARDTAATTSFYSTSFMLHGHTGGGIGELWRSASMGLMHDKRPKQYRDFMDSRRWHYELSRRFDGSFGILGGGGYDVEKWGVAYGLCYTVPRKTMRITGAPPTKYSKPFKLPDLPWGTEADSDFLSLKGVPDKNGVIQDISGETLAKDASIPFIRNIHGKEEVSDDYLRRYIRHPDAVIRLVAASKVVGVNHGYIGWLAPGGKVRTELMMECLQSDSPRIRRAMFASISQAISKMKMTELLTPEVIALAFKAVADPKESWWVKDAALHVIGNAPADAIAPHVDLLLTYLDIDDWWLQNAAMRALTPVAADPRCYRKVLPTIGKLIQSNQRSALTLGLLPDIRARIQQASAEVQDLAVKTLRESYTGYTGVMKAPGGQDISSTYDSHLEYIAASLADIPGGLDVLYNIARERYPNEILPYKEFFLKADPQQFGPTLKKAITPIINDELIPEYVGRNRSKLHDEVTVEKQSPQPGGKGDAIDGLVALYDRAGQDQYGWHTFVDLKQANWAYHSFDPIPSEQSPWDNLVVRYRKVTPPAGMEQWFAPQFDPSKSGWKTGQSPFGQYDGKIPVGVLSKCSEACVGPVCYGSAPVHTLWEKEVLLLHGKFDVPTLKPGHRYRVRVNHRAHVGNGGGYAIYFNGKLLVEQPKGLGRGNGEQANGGFITSEFLDEFKGGEVTIAVKSFLRYNDKYKTKPTEKIPRGLISLQIDEQKLPPMGDDLVIKSASVVPMKTSAWEKVSLDESNDEDDPESFLYLWDGKWQANPKVLGGWKVLASVKDPDAFDPAKDKNAKNPFIQELSLRDNGKTQDSLFLWSGDYVINLNSYEAMKMERRKIGDQEYLFVETGGFRDNKPRPASDPRWLVFTTK